MTIRKALASLICAAVALLEQSCVEYYPASAFNPPQQQQPQQAPSAPPFAEAPESPPPSLPPSHAAEPDDALVASIALYPDPLIALILPASTAPADISAASSFLIQYGDASRVDSQPWSPSVKALAHYPTVITWMAENMAWTQALGSAFLSSPSDVMEAIQWMRTRAIAAGALMSTPQQRVYADGDDIEIYPAQPDSIYVPAYDASVVYADGMDYGDGGPLINYGDPYPAGPWLSFYFDWGQHRVWAGDRTVWREHVGWQPPRIRGDHPPAGAHQWNPPPGGSRALTRIGQSRGAAPHPRPMLGTPNTPPGNSKRPFGLPSQPGTGIPVPRNAAPRVRNAAPDSQPFRQSAAPGGRPFPERVVLPPPPARSYGAVPARPAAGETHSSPARGATPAAQPPNKDPQK
jgi:hypothetical protein